MMYLPHKLILASQSPRRKKLLEEIGLEFEIQTPDVDEYLDPDIRTVDLAESLAYEKAKQVFNKQDEDCFVIGADTIVVQGGELFSKPADHDEAVAMLRRLRNRRHQVITGVCILGPDDLCLKFHDITHVMFKLASEEEIQYYVSTYKPFDKAGSYGAQEWWGYLIVDRMEGSYFNVMGLPVHKIYDALKPWIKLST